MSEFTKYELDLSAPYAGPEGPYAIYALVDPKDETVRYIGQTIDPGGRLAAHCKSNERANFRLSAWVARLANDGHEPIMVILTKCLTEADVDELEYEIIDEYLDRGCDLYNQQKNKRVHFGVSQKTFRLMQEEMSLRKTTISKFISKLFPTSKVQTENAQASSDSLASNILEQVSRMPATIKDVVIKKDELVLFLKQVREEEGLLEAYEKLTDIYRDNVKELRGRIEDSYAKEDSLRALVMKYEKKDFESEALPVLRQLHQLCRLKMIGHPEDRLLEKFTDFLPAFIDCVSSKEDEAEKLRKMSAAVVELEDLAREEGVLSPSSLA